MKGHSQFIQLFHEVKSTHALSRLQSCTPEASLWSLIFDHASHVQRKPANGGHNDSRMNSLIPGLNFQIYPESS